MDDDLARDEWLDYQTDLLRPTGVDEPERVAESIMHGDLVVFPRTALDDLRPYLRHRPTCNSQRDLYECSVPGCAERSHGSRACSCGLAEKQATAYPREDQSP